MPLVPNTMRTRVINSLNTSGNFSIGSSGPTYALVDAACQAFVPLWVTSISADMRPGTGPPPPGVYLHAHSFTGANLITITNAYQTSIYGFAVASEEFGIPPMPPALTAMLFLTQCWAQEFIKFVDSMWLRSNIQDGGVVHNHFNRPPPAPPTNTHWESLDSDTKIAGYTTILVRSISNCMTTKMGSTKFNPSDPLSQFNSFITELTKAFLEEIRDNSVIVPIVGAGHIHALL